MTRKKLAKKIRPDKKFIKEDEQIWKDPDTKFTPLNQALEEIEERTEESQSVIDMAIEIIWKK